MKIRGKLVILIAIVVIVLFLVFGKNITGFFVGDETNGSSQSDSQGKIRISGAWALYPMMVKWAEEYQKIHPGIKIDVSAGGAGKGMADALGGLVDIGMVSRDIYPSEIEKGAFWVACTKDAVVPVVNSKNPWMDEINTIGMKRQTFEDIWITQKITTWKEVFGGSVSYKINVYTRSDSCGAAESWAKYFGDYKQEDVKGVAVYGDPGLAEAVRQDALGIGYNNLNFAYDAKTELPVNGLAIVPIDLNENGRIDDDENFYSSKSELVDAISKGVYPSPPARELNIVTKVRFTGVTKDFVQWILTDGQQYVSETGYIQLPQSVLSSQLEKIG